MSSTVNDDYLATFKHSVLPSLSFEDKAELIDVILNSCSSEEKTHLSIAVRNSLSVDFISTLPAHVSTCILSKLPIPCLMKCTRVCQAWYHVVTHSHQLWRRRISRFLATTEGLPNSNPYDMFLALGKWLETLKDNGVHKVAIRRPTCADARGPLSPEMWKCTTSRLYVTWVVPGQPGEGVLQCYQLCRDGRLHLLWEESLHHQFCLAVNGTALLTTGPQRSGLMWKCVTTGSVIASTRHREVCPWDVDYTPLLCADCDIVFVVKECPREAVSTVCVDPTVERPPVLTRYRLEGLSQDVLTGCLYCVFTEGEESAQRTHRLLLQTWDNTILLYNVVVAKRDGVTPLCTIQSRPFNDQYILKRINTSCVISFDKKTIGFVVGSLLFVLGSDTLSTVHIVDISTCCDIAATPNLRCAAVGQQFAIIFAQRDQVVMATENCTMFIVSFTAHIIRQLFSYSWNVVAIANHILSHIDSSSSFVVIKCTNCS